MSATALATVLDDPGAWADAADAALALLGIDGACVVGHLEADGARTLARAADGTLLGWSDATATYDADGRCLRLGADAEWLLLRAHAAGGRG